MAITQVEIRTEEHTGTVLCVEGLWHGMFARRTHELTDHQTYYKSITKRIFHP